MNLENKKIWIAGHKGLVGSALSRRLSHENSYILTADFDLRHQHNTYQWLADNKPDIIIMAAAKVGGIHANAAYPADFIYDNLSIQNNIIHGAHLNDIENLIFLGSSCIYPKNCPQPMQINHLMTASLEPTNEPYAMAKLAGLSMINAYNKQYGHQYSGVLPTNLYGPHDNYHPDNAHVPAALIMRIHAAKINNDPYVTIWGTGKPLREFMHVDDLADAITFLLKNDIFDTPMNIGSDDEISIYDFACLVKKIVGFKGDIVFDTSKPDGVSRKKLDNTRLHAYGWKPKISLEKGLVDSYQWFLDNQSKLRQK